MLPNVAAATVMVNVLSSSTSADGDTSKSVDDAAALT